MIHQHLAFPGQLNQAGFHTTFHQRLSVARRELTWGFFLQVQEEAILQGSQYTQKPQWGTEDKPGSLYGHGSKSMVRFLLLFFKGNILGTRT